MNCEIEIKRTQHCIACGKGVSSDEKANRVRVRSDVGFSIYLMCPPCMQLYKSYKEKKAEESSSLLTT